MWKRLGIVCFIALFAGFFPVKASHIVGGEVTYVCLENNRYSITITIYEDCLTGDPTAIAEDNPAYLNIFDGNGNAMFVDEQGLPSRDEINVTQTVSVPANFSNACITNYPRTCLIKKSFTKTYYLPPNATGYTVVYQRCCRNASITNLRTPALIGATYYCNIPPVNAAACNNSAVFKNYPPQIICVNNPLVYDHAATDTDGDSLSYEFCNTYTGGGTQDFKPNPTPPPFSPVTYVYPYSYRNPMTGFPPIKIDPVTGIITGTPNMQGRFVVTVCCHEWRNGVMINTLTREFQFVVTNCSKAVVANIPQFSDEANTYIINCKDHTVHFVNHSTGGFSYDWDFGIPGATSNAFEPTYTYPDSGTYIVKLVVNKGSTCPDSISRLVKVYPVFKTDFVFNGLNCPGAPIDFIDKSFGTYMPVTSWIWTFSDGTTDNVQDPIHRFEQGGVYNVILTSRNYKGCTDTAFGQIVIEQFHPFAGNDTIIVKGESINFNATGGKQYAWTPISNLTDPNINDPAGYFPDTGVFSYNVHVESAYGCKGEDMINIKVVNQGAFFVPSAFTPNGDGRNDIFRPVTIGYGKLNYFRVYNRFGQQVFTTVQLGDGWDGTINGQDAQVDVYYWQLSATDRNSVETKSKGNVTLIR